MGTGLGVSDDQTELDAWVQKIKRTTSLPDDVCWSLLPASEDTKYNTSSADRQTWCFCNQRASGQVIACDNLDCDIEWFHFVCVGLAIKPLGRWFCPRCKMKRGMHRKY